MPTLLAKLLRLSNGTNKTVVILIHSVVSRYIFSVLFLFLNITLMFFLFSGIFTSSFVHKFSFDSRVNFGVMSSSKSSRNHSRGIDSIAGRET